MDQNIAEPATTFAGLRHLFAECAKRSPERRSVRRGASPFRRVCEKIAGAAKLSPGCVTISPSVRKDRRSGEAFAGEITPFAINRRIDASILQLMNYARFNLANCLSH